jgi:hypothetical protein
MENLVEEGIMPLIIPSVWSDHIFSDTYYHIFLTFTYFDDFA